MLRPSFGAHNFYHKKQSTLFCCANTKYSSPAARAPCCGPPQRLAPGFGWAKQLIRCIAKKCALASKPQQLPETGTNPPIRIFRNVSRHFTKFPTKCPCLTVNEPHSWTQDARLHHSVAGPTQGCHPRLMCDGTRCKRFSQGSQRSQRSLKSFD